MNAHALPLGSAGWCLHCPSGNRWTHKMCSHISKFGKKASFTSNFSIFSARRRNSRMRHAEGFGRVLETEMNHNIPAGRAPGDYEALFAFARTVRRPRVEYGLWFPNARIRSKTGQAAEDSCQLWVASEALVPAFLLTIPGTGQASTQVWPVSINHANSFTWQLGHGVVPDGIQRRSHSYPPSSVSLGVNALGMWNSECHNSGETKTLPVFPV